jgi:hypothetical protein
VAPKLTLVDGTGVVPKPNDELNAGAGAGPPKVDVDPKDTEGKAFEVPKETFGVGFPNEDDTGVCAPNEGTEDDVAKADGIVEVVSKEEGPTP